LELNFIQGIIESDGDGERADNLNNKSVLVSDFKSLNIDIFSANIVDGFIIKHEGNISILKRGNG
jgi:hypothetical protein